VTRLPRLAAAVGTLLWFTPGLGAQAPALQNGDFETKSTKKDDIAGYTIELGAQNGAQQPADEITLDPKVKHGGKHALHFAGTDTTRGWRSVTQQLVVRPGATYKLTGFIKAENIKPGFVKGTQIAHFQNCHVGVFLSDGNGELVGQDLVRPEMPTSDWKKFDLNVKAPDSTRKAQVTMFLSMPGDFWVDDLVLTVEGGAPVAAPKLVFREDFAKAGSVPSQWKKELGARNGDGGEDAAITIDPAAGASAESPRSLKLSGNENTIRWYTLGRTCDAAPGNLFELKAKVKAQDVRKEGIQFPNWHLSLLFLDKAGNSVGVPRFASPGDGTYDWKDVELSATGPLETASVRVGIFLSMSGSVWVDDLELTVDQGAEPPYAKWLKKDAKHLTIRYSPNAGLTASIGDLAKRFDTAYEEIRKALAVDFDQKLTIYLYRDNDEGKQLVGRDLDFAEPDQRVVHQTVHSTLSHEMTHCIARGIGYAQTGLFGEGVAVWFNGAPPEAQHKAAAKLLADSKLPTIADLLAKFRDVDDSYPASGSFCGFLIETKGIAAFKTLYVAADPAAAAKEAIGESLEDAEKAWREMLAKQSGS
jgi:hypothetical protein